MASMEGCVIEATVSTCTVSQGTIDADLPTVMVGTSSSKKRKPRSRVRDKKNSKTVLFFAGFQMGEISQGVHLDVEENDSKQTQGSELRSTGAESECKFEEGYILEEEEDIDYVTDCYEDVYKFSNNRKSSCRQCSGVSGNTGKPKSQPSGLMKIAHENKASRKEWNVSKNCSAQKDNIGKKLEKQGVKKFGFDIYQRRTEQPVQTGQKKWDKPKKCNNRYSTNNPRRQRHQGRECADHPAALKYELKSSNLPEDGGSHMNKLIDLQHRDLTPEDYELLLLLDDSVAPKTVSESLLQSLAVMTVEEAKTVGELCSICMELYQASQVVKQLPCAHFFHEDCIDMWLSNSSLNCPLDGLAVEVT